MGVLKQCHRSRSHGASMTAMPTFVDLSFSRGLKGPYERQRQENA